MNQTNKIQLNDVGGIVYEKLNEAIENASFIVNLQSNKDYPDAECEMQNYMLSIHEDGTKMFPQEPIDAFKKGMEKILTEWYKKTNNNILSYTSVDGPYQSNQLCMLVPNGNHAHAVWKIEIQFIIIKK